MANDTKSSNGPTLSPLFSNGTPETGAKASQGTVEGPTKAKTDLSNATVHANIK